MADHQSLPSTRLSPIDNALTLTPVPNKGRDIYINAHPHWRPPWGRGIFGGGVVAQSLYAAQRTIPSTFSVHSMHCYFVRPGASSEPIFYHVERIRDGNGFISRAVQARQRDRRIFTATLGFTRDEPPRHRKGHMLTHTVSMPADLKPPPEVVDSAALAKAGPAGPDSRCECVRCPTTGSDDDGGGQGPPPEQRKLRHWIRARGPVGDDGCLQDDAQSHLAALAYMSDNYFIGTVARVHGATRFADQAYIDRTVDSFDGSEDEKVWMRKYFEELAREEAGENNSDWKTKTRAHVGMMVSLNHTIFFHQPRGFRADRWMLMEMDTPWAGSERGLVTQRIWGQNGELLATCLQEGIVRLTPDDHLESAKL